MKHFLIEVHGVRKVIVEAETKIEAMSSCLTIYDNKWEVSKVDMVEELSEQDTYYHLKRGAVMLEDW